MSQRVKHVISGDEIGGWSCWQCSFSTRDVEAAAVHDGSYTEVGACPSCGSTFKGYSPFVEGRCCINADWHGTWVLNKSAPAPDALLELLTEIRELASDRRECWAEASSAIIDLVDAEIHRIAERTKCPK